MAKYNYKGGVIMKESYISLCREYYDKVGNKIENNKEMTIQQAKSLFDDFILNIVPDYFGVYDELIEKIEFDKE